MSVNFSGNFNVLEALAIVSEQLSNASTSNCLVQEQGVQFMAVTSNNNMNQETAVLGQLYASENKIYQNNGWTSAKGKKYSMNSSQTQAQLNSLTSGYNTDTQYYTNVNSENSSLLQGLETQMSTAISNLKATASLSDVVTQIVNILTNAIGNN